ncbi:MAG: hypothetical protein A3B68_07075 [Candidatus Melainabacteria bacterium RIFCSPHIGHO2_02_FULL_34_12]|nr:MAG: hypothetical protein A3B68_07075 [Candidatus Melainabacteria bacterium RIFCSPHIGHO2_02_FULL_34_12]
MVMRTSFRLIGLTALGAALFAQQARTEEKKVNGTKAVAASTDTVVINESPVSNEPRKVVLTPEGEKYIQRMRDIYKKTLKSEDGGLIDESTFITPQLKTRLFQFAAEHKRNKKQDQLKILRLNPAENGYHIAFDVKVNGRSERWYVSQEPYYKDQFPKDVLLGNTNLAFWKGREDGGVDKQTQTFILYRELFKNGKLNTELLLERLEGATANRESEKKDEAGIKSFNLSKDRKIGYIGLTDYRWQKDPIIRANYDDVKYFPEVMSHLGYQMVVANNGEPIVVTRPDTPKRILIREIEKLKEEGIRDFFIDIASHGDEAATLFYDNVTNCPCNNLFPRDLTEIFEKFPDCTVTMKSIACGGGGVSDEISSFKESSGIENRGTVFLQSKIFGRTQEGRLSEKSATSDIPKPHSTYYNVFFINHLLSGKSYGEAHILADEASKKLVPSDPEVWRTSPKGGIKTSQLFPKKNSLPEQIIFA